ncbi:hypothetical protein Dimus_032283 [Dionaea muscipula]
MSSEEVDNSKTQYREGRLADRRALTASVRALYGATYVRRMRRRRRAVEEDVHPQLDVHAHSDAPPRRS